MKFVKAFFLAILCSCVSQKIHRGVTAMEEQFQDHIGLIIFDPQENKNLITYNENKYFTPASNTKVLSLYASLKILADSIPSLYYQQVADSLIIWGSGDPSFLYPGLTQSQVFQFLKEADVPIYYSNENYHDSCFGPGWAWDDYSYSFSAEKSGFPIYGNTLNFTKESNSPFPNVTPNYFKTQFYLADSSAIPYIERDYARNTYFYHPSQQGNIDKQFPFKSSDLLIAKLLSDTLDRPVKLIEKPLTKSYQIIYHPQPDNLYKVMMQDSDNFIAEQLLLLCAGVISDTLNTELAIRYAKQEFFSDSPDDIIWRDGSGLSRYNLFTPRTMVWIWNQLLNQYGKDYLFNILAVGGVSGTLKDYYRAETPYIFGKTGTLSNNHNLSGFLITKKGKLLIFSFMNNNYPVGSTSVKKKMEQLLWEVHLNY